METAMHRLSTAALAAVCAASFAQIASAADVPTKAPVAPVLVAPFSVYFEVAGIYWTRSKPDSTPLWSTPGAPESGNLLNSSDFDSQWRPGVEGRFGVRLPNSWGFEFGAFWLGQQTSSRQIGPGVPDALVETVPRTDYNNIGATGAVANEYHSRIWGAEFNVTWQARPSVVVLAGPRYINLRENYTATGASAGVIFEVDDWRTNNNLWGGQVGARFDFMRMFGAAGPWIVDGDIRAGVYRNDVNNLMTRDQVLFSGGGVSTAWSAQGGLNVGYQFNNGMALTVGYEFLWLNDVALAPNQVQVTPSFSGSPSVHVMGVNRDDVLYQGLKVAFVVRR
jgi:hypothetical protein